MASDRKKMLIMTRAGLSDDGQTAVLAFSAAVTAATMYETYIFLTDEAAIWGFKGQAEGIEREGFPPLAELIEDFTDLGGQILICATCFTTCTPGTALNAFSAMQDESSELLPNARLAGFSTVIPIAVEGACLSF